MPTMHWNHLSLFALLQTSMPNPCSPALPPYFLRKTKDQTWCGITSTVYNEKKKKKRHNFDFSLIPLISHPLLIRDVPYSRAFILQVLLLLSNIPTDVLSVIPLVGYGETACNINKPTPEAGNQAWTHPEFSLPKVRSNTYSPKMLLVLSRMRHHAGWNTLLVRSGLQTCSNPFSTSKDDYAHLSLSIPPRTICSSSKVTFLST